MNRKKKESKVKNRRKKKPTNLMDIALEKMMALEELCLI